jgi:hypothetical protein
MSIEAAAERGLITPTEYMQLDRAGVYEYDPKKPPALCAVKGAAGAAGLEGLRSMRR